MVGAPHQHAGSRARMRTLVCGHPLGMVRPRCPSAQLTGCAAHGRVPVQPGRAQATLGRVGTLPSAGAVGACHSAAYRRRGGRAMLRSCGHGWRAGRCGRAASRITRGAGGGQSWATRPRGHATSMAAPGGSVMPMAGGCGRVMVTTVHWSTHGGAAVTAWTVRWSGQRRDTQLHAGQLDGHRLRAALAAVPGRAGGGLAEVAAARRAAVGHGLGAGRHRGHRCLGGQLRRVGGPHQLRGQVGLISPAGVGDGLGLAVGQPASRRRVERRRPRLPRRQAGGHGLTRRRSSDLSQSGSGAVCRGPGGIRPGFGGSSAPRGGRDSGRRCGRESGRLGGGLGWPAISSWPWPRCWRRSR